MDVISKQRGSLTKVENWGYRKLAYNVSKHSRGVYVYVQYAGDGELVTELERNLRLQDAVLKFQTVKVSNDAVASAASPEDIEFEHVEVPEDEPEESLAKTLGLEDVRDDSRGDRDRRGRHSSDDDGDGDDNDDNAASGDDESDE
jgi:small subunit ribosomal protein S6